MAAAAKLTPANISLDIAPVSKTKPSAEFKKELRMRITSVLQTTLEIEKLIALFFEEIQPLVEISGISYHHRSMNINCQVGRQCRRSCNYELTNQDEYFGEIKFSRHRKIEEHELENIESLMDLFIYPLKNALQYRQAIENALTDPLTGAGNRMAMDSALQREIELARRYDYDLTLLMVDIDKFKSINDQFGHQFGDEVLKAVASTLSDCIRNSDMNFRYGGEEFIVLLNKTDLDQALLVAERIRQSVMNCSLMNAKDQMVSVSIGTAGYEKGMDSDSLLSKADKAMYLAKEEGRNQVVCAPRMAAQ